MKPIQLLMLRDELIALCEDGSIWRKGQYTLGWIKLPEVREQTEDERSQEADSVMQLALSGTIHMGRYGGE